MKSGFGAQFSREVKAKRKENGLTQETVAAAVSISTRWYQEIEYGRIPSLEVGFKLATYLGVDPKVFSGEDKE